MLYNNIAIEGNIGSGKTTLAKFLAEAFESDLLLEQFEENEFLSDFYTNKNFALHAEVQFVLHRSKQLHHFYANQPKLIISDYMPLKSKLFARQNLVTKDFMLIQNLIDELLMTFPQPDLVIFLNRSVYELKENIAKRGRFMESDISTDYLLAINKAYNEFLNQKHDFPVLIINANEIELSQPNLLVQRFKKILNTKHQNGVQDIYLKEII